MRRACWIAFAFAPLGVLGQQYRCDDGSGELSVGILFGGSAIALNHFQARADQNEIRSVDVAFGACGGCRFVIAGLWLDPNNDGHPRDAVLVSHRGTWISHPDSDRFQSIPIPPVRLMPGQSFFVGVYATPRENERPFRLDLANPAGRSWISFAQDYRRLDSGYVFNLDQIGLPGNWMIRATAEVERVDEPLRAPLFY